MIEDLWFDNPEMAKEVCGLGMAMGMSDQERVVVPFNAVYISVGPIIMR